jgi:hypothetical protein
MVGTLQFWTELEWSSLSAGDRLFDFLWVDKFAGDTKVVNNQHLVHQGSTNSF